MPYTKIKQRNTDQSIESHPSYTQSATLEEKLIGLYKTKAAHYGAQKMYIFVPICVYSESNNKMDKEQFQTLIEKLLRFQQQHNEFCQFGVYFFENEANSVAVESWRKANQAILEKLDKNDLQNGKTGDKDGIRVPEWRKSGDPRLKQAEANYRENVENSNTRNQAVQKHLEVDIKVALEHLNGDHKRKLSGFKETTPEAARTHIRKETIEAIAQWQPKNSVEPKYLTVILCTALHQTVRHAMQIADEIGYHQDLIALFKLDPTKDLVKREREKVILQSQQVFNTPPTFGNLVQEIVNTVVHTSINNPAAAKAGGRVLASFVEELLEKQNSLPMNVSTSQIIKALGLNQNSDDLHCHVANNTDGNAGVSVPKETEMLTLTDNQSLQQQLPPTVGVRVG